MHILVATDGSLNRERAVELLTRLVEDGDTVTVFTAIHFPRSVLKSVAEIGGVEGLAAIADAAGGALNSGAVAAERLASTQSTSRPADPQQVAQSYFDKTASASCGPLVDMLAEAGVEASISWSATENQPARTILATATAKKVDLLVLGSHGQGGFEGPLGSTVTKCVRRAEIPVLLVR